ncbi:dihydrofolate reductase [Weissella uvarum]|uniref:dihydrofolate reductase n=1 Tax=Weissella uvarum TaxID=1479233 RepID=UPI00196218A6|nr:dihydrofolate reductase [Weissella uvarum]MBM7617088.1 dihydrofolate reductase [Weissella uvarum]MCM0595384.1 dihydrofolate reductase [Weissella uvarum]
MGNISMIWAQTNDGTIALKRAIPWHEKSDLQLFKKLTLNKIVVMGRHTMESFNGRPLPKRTNLVLTHDHDLVVPEGFQKVYSVAEVLELMEAADQDLAVIGGKPIYEAFYDVANTLYVTYLDTDFTGDVQMPTVDKTVWQGEQIAQGVHNDEDDYDFETVAYTRR